MSGNFAIRRSFSRERAMRILVIDDEPAVADLLADALRQDGHDPTVAASGELGLVAMEEMHPDAVFLDVAMPDMSGIEVLRRIRALHPSLPVVLITGNAEAAEIREAKRLGISEVIEKPGILNGVTEVFAALERNQPD
jgi:two-component system OmpR family response regulator